MLRLRVFLFFLAITCCGSQMTAQQVPPPTHPGAAAGSDLPDAPSAQKSKTGAFHQCVEEHEPSIAPGQ